MRLQGFASELRAPHLGVSENPQRAQYPLIKEYSLNHIRDPIII